MTKLPTMLETDADFSADSVYRYSLKRVWDHSKPVAFLIGLNPSTADHWANDPTIRREIAFAVSWGCGALLKGNLFAFRATKPLDMMRASDPIGRDNDEWLLKMAAKANIIVACWGSRGMFKGRDAQVRELLIGPWHCLGYTNGGSPRHPLYLKADTKLLEYA